MKYRLMPLIVMCGLAATAHADLQAGAQAPDFSADAALSGKVFHYQLADARRRGPVVVYFYPSAYTSGCNAQAHYFAVNMDRFAEAGASVVGVSLDNIERLTSFSADPDYCGGKVPVASDASGKIAASYGLKITPESKGATDTRGVEIGHGFAERTTFIVGSDGRVVATIGGLAPTKNVEQALAEVEKLSAAKAAR
jgi:peroxiredoxin